MSDELGFETKLVHAGEAPLIERAVTLPVFQTSTFQYSSEDGGYHDIRYQRLNNNPNQSVVSAKIAALEGAEKGLVFASGMAAIASSLLALVENGEHILAQSDLYGGTRYFFDKEFQNFGREVSYFDVGNLERLPEVLRKNTVAIYIESISNPTTKVPDFRKVVAFAKKHGLLVFIDNTFCSPAVFNPHRLGVDIVLHSATKYLNGHSDIVAGAVVGKENLIRRVLETTNLLGGCLDPHACYLLHRGMKTMGLRVRRQSETALALARMLQQQSKVTRVYYPGLNECEGHVHAKELFRGFGGMLSFVIEGGESEAERLMDALELAVKAPSLGGLETLVTRPAVTSHSGLSAADRKAQGIEDALIRVSVGIEDFADLERDFQKALKYTFSAG